MKMHPLLVDPEAVAVILQPVPDAPAWPDFARSACVALEALQVVLSGEKVVLKPNVTSGEHFHNPENGIGTHPAFIGGMVDYLRGHGARAGGVYVVEDPRDSDDNHPRHWQGTGYLEMAAQTGAKLRCPTAFTCVRKPVPHPLVHASRNVSRPAVAADTVLINVPKLKTHNLAITTLCMKNLMGLDNVFDRHYCAQAIKDLPPEWQITDRPHKDWMTSDVHELWQFGLARRLVDLAQVLKPHLNVVEGIVGRDGTGFNRGSNRTLGIVVAGINVVAVDSIASYLLGHDPRELIYLKLAASAGLGQNDPARLRVYVADTRDGGAAELAPCHDLAALRCDPPFKVLRDIKE